MKNKKKKKQAPVVGKVTVHSLRDPFGTEYDLHADGSYRVGGFEFKYRRGVAGLPQQPNATERTVGWKR